MCARLEPTRSRLSKRVGVLSLLLLAVACNPKTDDVVLVGSTFACLFDVRLDCQVVDRNDAQGWDPTTTPAERFEQVAGGHDHLCGVTEDGDPICWGWNAGGQTDIPADLTVASFALSYENTCALDPVGRLTCWGNEWTGVNDAPEGPFDKVAIAERVGCGWSAETGWTCWGDWLSLEETEDGDVFEWNIPADKPESLLAFGLNICMLDAAGRITCWGYANYGLTNPPDGEGWHDLTGGTRHACAFDADDQVMCWGSDITSSWRQFPEGDWAAFTAGPRADCGIRADGEVDCWGCIRVDPLTCDWDD